MWSPPRDLQRGRNLCEYRWKFYLHLSPWFDSGCNELVRKLFLDTIFFYTHSQIFKYIFFLVGTHCLDIRQEQCFTRYKHGQCSGALEGFYHKNLCCCSPVGKAWGSDRCEPCPRFGTPAFQELCPKGEGFLDKKDINECTEFPGLCGNGRCKNSIGSFNCRCNKGYALDEFKIRCVGKLL